MSDQAFQISQVPSHLRLSMHRHHKASGQAVVVVLRGRDVYLGEYSSPGSHEKYQATIAEFIAAPQERAGMTVSEVIVHY